MNEFENIPYVKIKDIRIFINEMIYRTPHYHKSMELILVLSGEMEVNAERTKVKLMPHDMLLINRNSLHELRACSSGCCFLCLQFQPESYFTNFPSILFDGQRPGNYMKKDEYLRIEKLLIQMAYKYFSRKEFYELYCVSTTIYILYELLAHMPHHIISDNNKRQELMSARVMRLINYVDQNYMYRPSLSDFAESEGRSLSYISRFVKTALNQNFQSYVNTVRFYAACRFIANGNMSMLDICYEVGFSDYRYFSNIFKEYTGLTPAQFQKAQYKKIKANTKSPSVSYSQEYILSDEDSLKTLNRLTER